MHRADAATRPAEPALAYRGRLTIEDGTVDHEAISFAGRFAVVDCADGSGDVEVLLSPMSDDPHDRAGRRRRLPGALEPLKELLRDAAPTGVGVAAAVMASGCPHALCRLFGLHA